MKRNVMKTKINEKQRTLQWTQISWILWDQRNSKSINENQGQACTSM